jgi:hypothetical protein
LFFFSIFKQLLIVAAGRQIGLKIGHQQVKRDKRKVALSISRDR